MKEVPLEEWAKRLLEDQISRLGELRNASPRDPGFKLWRQTTLTVIQRVWPGNLSRSESFRRIPFSTPSGKSSRAQVRDYYERGCAEAVSYLKRLMLEIENSGLKPAQEADARPAAPPNSPARPAPVLSQPTSEPKDMEMLDEGLVGTGPLSMDELDARSEAAVPPPQFVSPMFDSEPDLLPPSASPPSIFTSPVFGDEPDRPHPAPPDPLASLDPVDEDLPAGFESDEDPGTPTAEEHPAPARAAAPSPVAPQPAAPQPVVPPTVAPRVRSREPVAGPAPPGPTPPATSPGSPEEPSRPPGSRSPRVARRGDRRALKDMLGFSDEHHEKDPADAAPEVEETQARPRPSAAFGIPAPRTPDPSFATPLPEALIDPLEDESEEESIPEEQVAHVSPGAVPAAAVPPASQQEAEPDPFAHEEEEEADVTLDLDPDEEEMAEEFLRTSPVLSAQARPLNAPRHTRSVPTETAVAGALAALAADITRLGVPEGHRAATRAALLGLARQFDEHTVSWLSIRQAIAMVLEYPALARRMIPLLVPYLDLE